MLWGTPFLGRDVEEKAEMLRVQRVNAEISDTEILALASYAKWQANASST